MKFSNKKILFALVVILTIAAGAIFYWQKTHIPPVSPISPDISSESVKEKCLEEVSEMDEKQLIEEINTLTFATGEDLKSINKQMVNYLFCDLERDRTEEAYNRVRELTDRLEIPEEKKTEIFKTLSEAYNEVNDNLYRLALGDLSQLCPDELPDLLLKAITRRALKPDDERLVGHCKNMCNLMEQWAEDRDELEREIINEPWSDALTLEDQYKSRAAIVYRFGGQDLALKICDNVIDSKAEKENCISMIKYTTENFKKCDTMRKDLESLLCDIPYE